jgi:transposase
MHRLGLRDDEWDRIEHLLPGRQGWVGVTAKDNRLFVEAVLYRCRTGVPWRDLPEHFGDWKNIHRRYSRWAKSGVWERVFEHLAADADHEYAMLDSTVVRAHQHSAGAPKTDGDGPSHWTLARRIEHQDPYFGRCTRKPGQLPPDGWRGS